jgi:cell wall-associated NlpC family hydrolase
MAAVKAKPRKPTGYQARPWLKLVPRPTATENNDVRLYMPNGTVVLDQKVTSTSVHMSLDEAATLTVTVMDPTGDLSALTLNQANEDRLLSGVDIRWRGVWWRIARLERGDNEWSITAEDRVAAYLRSHSREVAASRGDVTRAQFVRQLALGVRKNGGIDMYIPELRDRQGIYKPDVPKAKKTKKNATASTDTASGSVWDTSNATASGWGAAASKVTVKGTRANSSQLAVLNEVLTTAASLDATKRVMIGCVMCVTGESLAGQARVSISGRHKGAYHQEVGRGWARTAASANDTAASTKRFLNGGDLGAPGWKQRHGSVKNSSGNLGEMVNAVQVAGASKGRYFADFEPEATKTVGIWLDRNKGAAAEAKSSGDPEQQYYRGSYKFRTSSNSSEPQNWWDAMGALADEVQWHRWAVANTLGYATDTEMIRGNPVLWLSRDRNEVHDLTWSWDYRREASELTASIALADPFQLLPGMVAMVDDEAPVSGRWLVDSIDVDPLSTNVAQVQLRRPGAKLLEPAPEIRMREVEAEAGKTVGGKQSYGGDDATARGVESGSTRARIVAAAEAAYRIRSRFSYAQVRPYPKNLKSGGRTDCSGFATLCYKEAGVADPNGLGYNGQGYTGTLGPRGTVTSKPLPGDMVQFAPFYTRHVGIYIGNGMMIDFGSNPMKRRKVTDYGAPYRYLRYPGVD